MNFSGISLVESNKCRLLKQTSNAHDVECISICCYLEHPLEQPFYASFGFKEIGLVVDVSANLDPNAAILSLIPQMLHCQAYDPAHDLFQ